MDITMFNKISNFNDYVSLTTKLKNVVNFEITCSKEILKYLKTMNCFEVQYFKMYNECGAAFTILNTILNNKDYFVASSNYLEDLALLLRYWLHAFRHDIIVNIQSNNWWTFLEEILSFIQRLCLRNQARDMLLKSTSEYLLELATDDLLDMIQVNKVLKTLNKCTCCTRETRLQLLDSYNDYFIKLSKYIAGCRHMDTQLTGMETLMRFLVNRHSAESRSKYARAWFTQPLYPTDVVTVFLENPQKDVFPAMRSFLMAYNNCYKHVVSVLCVNITFGRIIICGSIWVDFNIKLNCITISLMSETLIELGIRDAFMPELLQIFTVDTETVESNKEAVVLITTKAGPKFLYDDILEIIDEEAKMITFQLCNVDDLPLVEKCLRHIYGVKYRRRAPSFSHDEGTRFTVSNSDDDSRHNIQKGFVRRCGYASISTKQSRIPSSIALFKSKEANTVNSLPTTTNQEPEKSLNTNNNTNLLDHITKDSFDFRKISSSITLNNLRLKNRNPNVKENNLVTINESLPRDSEGFSNLTNNLSRKKTEINKPLNETIIDSNIVENIINESQSRDATSDTFIAPSASVPKKNDKQKKKSINKIVLEDDIIQSVIDEPRDVDYNNDGESNISLRRKKDKPPSYVVLNEIPQTILDESLSRRADFDVVKEHFLNKDDNNDYSIIEVINNDKENSDNETIDEVLNYLNPLDSSIEEIIDKPTAPGLSKPEAPEIIKQCKPQAPKSLLEVANDEISVINSAVVIENAVSITTDNPRPNAKKEIKKKIVKEKPPKPIKKTKLPKTIEKTKLPKTIEKTKSLMYKSGRTSARLLEAAKSLEQKSVYKRKLYSKNQELEGDQQMVDVNIRKSLQNGGSCYKDILRDRQKHNARKSIKSKVLVSPPLSPSTIKRNELFDQLMSDVTQENIKSPNRDIALYNFTSDEDDDDINMRPYNRSNMYDAPSKSPDQPKTKKNKRKTKIKNKTSEAKKKSKRKIVNENIDDGMVVVNIIESVETTLQDEKMRDARNEDVLNTSIIIPDGDSEDDMSLSKLIPKQHINPIVVVEENEHMKIKAMNKEFQNENTVPFNEISDGEIERNINGHETMEINNDSVKNYNTRKQTTKIDTKNKKNGNRKRELTVVENTKTKKRYKEKNESLNENVISRLISDENNKTNDNISIIEDIEVNNESVNVDKRKKQRSKTNYNKKRELIEVDNETISDRKKKLRKNKENNQTLSTIHSSSPLPDLIIETNEPIPVDKSDENGSIDRIKMINNINDIEEIELNDNDILNITNDIEENAFHMPVEGIQETEINNVKDKEIMPPPSSGAVKKRFLSKSLDSIQINNRKRKLRLSDYCHKYPNDQNCESVLNDIISANSAVRLRRKQVKEEANASEVNMQEETISDLAENVYQQGIFITETTEEYFNRLNTMNFNMKQQLIKLKNHLRNKK